MITGHTYPFKSVDAPQQPEVRTHNLGDLLKEKLAENQYDMVNHPPHYTQHPSGVECIQVTEHMNFCLGNAVKYIWRAGLKSNNPIQDLEKAVFYLNREIKRLKASK